jgi:hypothetical protein
MHADAYPSDFTIVEIGNIFLGLIAALCSGNIDVQYGHDDRYATHMGLVRVSSGRRTIG